MAIVRDEVTEVLLEGEKGGGRALRRRQWGVFWVFGLVVYGRMLVKEIAGISVRRTITHTQKTKIFLIFSR